MATVQGEDIKLENQGQQSLPKPPDSSTSIEDILAKKGVISSEQVAFVKAEAKRRQESTEKVIGL
ncbi:MAG: hypothetical protein HYT11_01930, partial [Candidatus Levybacteria bacterium]|nr:hypothetical protein [Candidatus Levybacteria bacterium]